MLEKIQYLLLNAIVVVILIASYDYYKNNSINKVKDEILVFSAKNIIENKKLQIKKAILNNENIQSKEKELEDVIKNIDFMLENISKSSNKPVFQKEMILFGNIKDITPIIEKALREKGLL